MFFNVSDKVHVRLTAHGRKILRRQHAVFEEHDGWSCWQLWDLMARLGVHCHLSADPPFEPTIKLQPGWKRGELRRREVAPPPGRRPVAPIGFTGDDAGERRPEPAAPLDRAKADDPGEDTDEDTDEDTAVQAGTGARSQVWAKHMRDKR